MEKLINAVAAVGFDDAAAFRLGVFLNHAPDFAYQHTRFYNFDGFLKTLAGGLDDTNRVAVGEGFGADVVCFIEVAMKAAVVECDVEVENVTVKEEALVGNAVADDFVSGGAEGFGEVDVV